MEKNYLLDFDGVIINSQERFELDMKGNTDFNDWMEYLNAINWYKFLRECTEIDDSFSVLEQLQRLKRLRAIITTIHGFQEGREKEILLRERNIYVPIIYVLPRQKKSEVFIPSFTDVLVDDKPRNCEDWISAGGQAILFDSHAEKNEKGKIKSLKQLL